MFYQGKPLARAKLELIAESGWKREFKTDEQGLVEGALPWCCAYIVEVQHTDATSGKLGQEAYDSVRCVRNPPYPVSAQFVRVDALEDWLRRNGLTAG